jgi:hypothetical protein
MHASIGIVPGENILSSTIEKLARLLEIVARAIVSQHRSPVNEGPT